MSKELILIKRTIEARKKTEPIMATLRARTDTIQTLYSLEKHGMIRHFKVVQIGGALHIKIWMYNFKVEFTIINGTSIFTKSKITLL